MQNRNGNHSFGRNARRVLAVLWSLITVVFLLFVSVAIIGDPRFPLNIGLINTTGRTGLWATLLPATLGFLAVGLVLHRSQWGAWMLGLYSLFWSGLFLASLPIVWNAKKTFCTSTFCITTPWITRLLVLSIATPFALIAIWTHRYARDCSKTVHP